MQQKCETPEHSPAGCGNTWGWGAMGRMGCIPGNRGGGARGNEPTEFYISGNRAGQRHAFIYTSLCVFIKCWALNKWLWFWSKDVWDRHQTNQKRDRKKEEKTERREEKRKEKTDKWRVCEILPDAAEWTVLLSLWLQFQTDNEDREAGDR